MVKMYTEKIATLSLGHLTLMYIAIDVGPVVDSLPVPKNCIATVKSACGHKVID